MELANLYRILTKTIAAVALMSVLWTNFLPYYCWMTGTDLLVYELCDPMDAESEKETKTSEKDKYNEIHSDFYKLQLQSYKPSLKMKHAISSKSMHHPEIPTPPPQISPRIS